MLRNASGFALIVSMPMLMLLTSLSVGCSTTKYVGSVVTPASLESVRAENAGCTLEVEALPARPPTAAAATPEETVEASNGGPIPSAPSQPRPLRLEVVRVEPTRIIVRNGSSELAFSNLAVHRVVVTDSAKGAAVGAAAAAVVVAAVLAGVAASHSDGGLFTRSEDVTFAAIYLGIPILGLDRFHVDRSE